MNYDNLPMLDHRDEKQVAVQHQCKSTLIFHECYSFPGSVWERTVTQAPPANFRIWEAEPPRQAVPRRSLGTSSVMVI